MTRNIPFCDAQLMFYISDWTEISASPPYERPPPPHRDAEFSPKTENFVRKARGGTFTFLRYVIEGGPAL